MKRLIPLPWARRADTSPATSDTPARVGGRAESLPASEAPLREEDYAEEFATLQAVMAALGEAPAGEVVADETGSGTAAEGAPVRGTAPQMAPQKPEHDAAPDAAPRQAQNAAVDAVSDGPKSADGDGGAVAGGAGAGSAKPQARPARRPHLRVVPEPSAGNPASVAAETAAPDLAVAPAGLKRPDRGAAKAAAQPAPGTKGPSLSRRLGVALAPWRPMLPFMLATLSPLPLLLLAGLAGGVWSLVAFLWMAVAVFAIDELAHRQGITGPQPATLEMADRFSLILAGVHFALLLFALWALSGGAGFGFLSWILAFMAFGHWFGQVSNSNAHELIHRTDKRLFRAGMWVYISLLFGHHTSAHRLVHHRFVATTDDPNTASEGENFYLFAARAWPGAFIAGYEMERNRRLARKGQTLTDLNPYILYVGGGAGFVVAVTLLLGIDGLLAYLLLCAFAQVQLLLSDYVQHYGLLRRKLPSGALEPAGSGHSWDAPHPLSNLLMLNAPRHSDHHGQPQRPYPELRLSPGGEAPMLPYSLPAMATIALVPSVWHRLMDTRLALMRREARKSSPA